jgi:hypothetical protein
VAEFEVNCDLPLSSAPQISRLGFKLVGSACGTCAELSLEEPQCTVNVKQNGGVTPLIVETANNAVKADLMSMR